MISILCHLLIISDFSVFKPVRKVTNTSCCVIKIHRIQNFKAAIPTPVQRENKMAPDDPTAADAEWKKIQQNTFTRWCNEHLMGVQKYIYNLETDLSDGVILIDLLQVLSKKTIPRYNRKPTFLHQKTENVAIALKFIEDENIRLVNIGKIVLKIISDGPGHGLLFVTIYRPYVLRDY